MATETTVGSRAIYKADTARTVDRAFCMDVRSNLLYDLCGVPQLGVEFCLSHGWTVGLGGVYAWWGKPGQTRFRHIQCVELNVRKYFTPKGRSPLTGWHAGLFGRLLRYDVCVGSKGWLSGDSDGGFFDHPTISVGAEGGYSLHIGRRLNIDFSLGIGYLDGRYMSYRRSDKHSAWASTHHRRFFGPVKAEIALVWIIGKGGIR